MAPGVGFYVPMFHIPQLLGRFHPRGPLRVPGSCLVASKIWNTSYFIADPLVIPTFCPGTIHHLINFNHLPQSIWKNMPFFPCLSRSPSWHRGYHISLALISPSIDTWVVMCRSCQIQVARTCQKLTADLSMLRSNYHGPDDIHPMNFGIFVSAQKTSLGEYTHVQINKGVCLRIGYPFSIEYPLPFKLPLKWPFGGSIYEVSSLFMPGGNRTPCKNAGWKPAPT